MLFGEGSFRELPCFGFLYLGQNPLILNRRADLRESAVRGTQRGIVAALRTSIELTGHQHLVLSRDTRTLIRYLEVSNAVINVRFNRNSAV